MLAAAERPEISKYIPTSTCCSLLLPYWLLHTRHTLLLARLAAVCRLFCNFRRSQVDPIPTSREHLHMTYTSFAQSSYETLTSVCPTAAAVYYRASPTESSRALLLQWAERVAVYARSCVQSYPAMPIYHDTSYDTSTHMIHICVVRGLRQEVVQLFIYF